MSTRRYGFGSNDAAEISTLLPHSPRTFSILVTLPFLRLLVGRPHPRTCFLSQPQATTCSFTPESSPSTTYFAVNTCNQPPNYHAYQFLPFGAYPYACIIVGIIVPISRQPLYPSQVLLFNCIRHPLFPPSLRCGWRPSCMSLSLGSCVFFFFSSRSSYLIVLVAFER
jgi:hypothetical protein